MSSSHLFLNFPVLNYAGFAATNLMARAIIQKKFKDNFNMFYEYKVPHGQTADAVAYNLYGKSELVWIIYLFNDIVDPYYDWPLSEENFDNVIIQQYGSVANAQSTILGYRNNWPSDDRQLDPSVYSALPADQKKYWQPNLAPGNRVTSYSRAERDTMVTTNQIVRWTVADYTNTNSFETGEWIVQGNSQGVVACSNTFSNTLVIQHTSGGFDDHTQIVGKTSGATAVPQSQSLIITPVIPTDQVVYYSPLNAYDSLTEQNEAKSIIKLLRAEYIQMVQDALATAMSTTT